MISMNNNNKYKNSRSNQTGNISNENKNFKKNTSVRDYLNEEPEIEDETLENGNENDEELENSELEQENPALPRMPMVPSISSLANGGKSIIKGLANLKNFGIFFAKYKIIIIIALIILFVFFLLIIVSMDLLAADSSGGNKLGLAGYDYYEVEGLCDKVKVYNPNDGTYTKELDFETEYIPGVLYKEVRGFSDAPEAMKLYAIAARSYAIKAMSDDCTIEGSTRVQDFVFDESILKTITEDSHPLKQAAMNTYGLVAVKNNELMKLYYDAACYRGEDDSNYFIGYGSLTTGSEKTQKIPKSWSNDGLLYYINKSKANGVECYQGHGYGISQYGAYYLAKEQGYTFTQLLDFYATGATLSSLYQAANSNYLAATSDGLNNILATSLRDYLNSQGSSVEAFNDHILSNVLDAGIGTREAVVSAATSLVGDLYQMYGVRLPYTLCGQHGCGDMKTASGVNVNKTATSFYGADPDWGSKISNSSDGKYHYSGSIYTRYGPDCSGFVSWTLHNAGFKTSVLNADSFGNLGTKTTLNGSQVAEPGDLLWNKGHIMLVVGVDTNKKVYYIAHASGGESGVKINTVSFSDNKKKAVDMSSWYASNKKDISNEEFINTYRAGYIDGYTGQFSTVAVAS